MSRPPYLLLGQGVVLQPIYLLEFLGLSNAGQLCEDIKVAGHTKPWQGTEEGELGQWD